MAVQPIPRFRFDAFERRVLSAGKDGENGDSPLLKLICKPTREGNILMTSKELVERFYYELWNRADEILDKGFRFRGSLGPEWRRRFQI